MQRIVLQPRQVVLPPSERHTSCPRSLRCVEAASSGWKPTGLRHGPLVAGAVWCLCRHSYHKVGTRRARRRRCKVHTLRATAVDTQDASNDGLQGVRKKRYDPDQVAADAMENPFAVVARALEVLGAIARRFAIVRFDEWRSEAQDESVVKRRSRELRELLIELGPCYIKVGQALANRPDILRQDYMQELEQLQDRVPPFPTEEAMQILREELGQHPDEVFSELSALPVSAASLGQVYRGKLRETGEEVAVKVQRPNLEGKIALDLFIFRSLSFLFNDWAAKNLGCNITLVVDEFASRLWEESDYVQEAMNLQCFARNFATDPTVKIPRVSVKYTRERVITMEWIDGIKSTDLQAMRRAGIDVDVFIRNGVQAALRQLLEFGLFHGDPHAGNIFALEDGRIAYVDFGNVATLTKAQRDVMLRAITNVSNSDYQELANDFVNLGFMRPGVDTTEMVPAMAMIWQDTMGTSIKDFSFRMVTERFSRLVYSFPIRVPAQFSLVFRALLMQEGICLVLNPDFSIIEVALPYVSRRLLSDPDPSLRSQLLNVVFKAVDGRPTFQWERLINLVGMAKQARGGNDKLFDDVVLDLCRSLRRDFAAGNGNTEPVEVLRSALEALVADDRLRTDEAFAVIELLSAELSRDLPGKVLAALLQDSLQDLAKAAPARRFAALAGAGSKRARRTAR
mmetsp:Transcript_19441/g.35245  ORF Transcript_19441/g.35245 Transcript_19441/m.35245 type:complete len:683 (+) Transcript_19441:57-2105(+)